VNGASDGVVILDGGVPTPEDPEEEGAGDDEIIDSSCEDDGVGISNGRRDWRLGCGISTGGDPVCS
jgi:hypothetical protein